MDKRYRQHEQLDPGSQDQNGEVPGASYTGRQPGDEYIQTQRGSSEAETPRQARDQQAGWQNRRLPRQAQQGRLPPQDNRSAPQRDGPVYEVPHSRMHSFERPQNDHAYFRGDDWGGGAVYGDPSYPGDYVSGPGGYYEAAPFAEYGADTYSGRGSFFARAGDRFARWFGHESAVPDDGMDHSGRGPRNYTRSDERILEDACDHLTADRFVDARDITVTVLDSEVTLDGTVSSRRQKRRAEDCVYDIPGAGHVQNNLRIDESRGQGTAADKQASQP